MDISCITISKNNKLILMYSAYMRKIKILQFTFLSLLLKFKININICIRMYSYVFYPCSEAFIVSQLEFWSSMPQASQKKTKHRRVQNTNSAILLMDTGQWQHYKGC